MAMPDHDAPEEVWDAWLDQILPPMPPMPDELVQKLRRIFSTTKLS